LQAHNAGVCRIRGGIEKVFGTAKRSYRLRRTRWIGLAKAGLQVRLAAIAFNIRRVWRLRRRSRMRLARRPPPKKHPLSGRAPAIGSATCAVTAAPQPPAHRSRYSQGSHSWNVIDADVTNGPCEHHWHLKKERLAQ
jgi:hypothetical protein